jgi:hypothetical protein
MALLEWLPAVAPWGGPWSLRSREGGVGPPSGIRGAHGTVDLSRTAAGAQIAQFLLLGNR